MKESIGFDGPVDTLVSFGSTPGVLDQLRVTFDFRSAVFVPLLGDPATKPQLLALTGLRLLEQALDAQHLDSAERCPDCALPAPREETR